MTRLRLLLSITCLAFAQFLVANCPTDADVVVEKIRKDGEQLIITYSISGKYIYDISSITVLNRTTDSRINVVSYTGAKNDLHPNKTYEIRWNVKQDVQIIERIKRSDFTIYAELTKESCRQLNQNDDEEPESPSNPTKPSPTLPEIKIPDITFSQSNFGFSASPFMGFTFGNKSKSRGLGLSYQLGFFYEGDSGDKTKFEFEVSYARYGLGLDRSSNVIHQDNSYELKRIRLKLKTLNFNPSVKYYLGNASMISVGLSFTYIANAQIKFKTSPSLNGENKYKNLSLFNESVLFPRAPNRSPVQRFTTGIFFTFEQHLRENQSIFFKVGGPLGNLLNEEYWDNASDADTDFLDFNDRRLKFSYLQIGYKWRLNS